MSEVTLNSFKQLFYGTQDHLEKLFKEELIFDEEIDSWLLMNTPWPIIFISILYLLFVLKLGPSIMENRQPLNLKYVLLIYNAFQSLYNAWMISLLLMTPGAVHYHVNHLCHPIPRHENKYLLRVLYEGSWYYFVLKIIDLLDTVFFVLRKKQSQVTFLHVYHHVNMVFSTWAYLRFIKGEQLLSIAILNSFVHVIMYTYYFLSALGQRARKFLWWKKYLTRLQIFQFILILAYNLILYAMNCTMPKIFVAYVMMDVFIFLYLFCIFYSRTYENTKKDKTKTT